MDNLIKWLTEDKNAAVQYRTKTELLNENADKQRVIDWVNRFLPANWQDTKGLWYTYYLTAIAECGLTYHDIPINKDKALNICTSNLFNFGCGDFMHLRALIMLGFYNEPQLCELIGSLKLRQLPDGGFLCLHRLNKASHIPKSCVKANNIALLFCSECKKHGVELDITNDLVNYFWNHKLFYKTSDLSTLMLDARAGWRTIDTFFPFEVMRVGLQNIIEAFCALGCGNDERLTEAWSLLDSKKNEDNQVILEGTLTKSYLPKEQANKPGKWVTFYTLLAEKERDRK